MEDQITARFLYRDCASLEKLAKYQKREEEYDAMYATYAKSKLIRSNNFNSEEFEKLRKSKKESLDRTLQRQQMKRRDFEEVLGRMGMDEAEFKRREEARAKNILLEKQTRFCNDVFAKCGVRCTAQEYELVQNLGLVDSNDSLRLRESLWLNVVSKCEVSSLRRNWGHFKEDERKFAAMKIHQYEHVRRVTKQRRNKIKRIALFAGRLRVALLAWYNMYAYAPGGSMAPTLADMQAHAQDLDKYT